MRWPRRRRDPLPTVDDADRIAVSTCRVAIAPFEFWISLVAVYAGLSHFLPLLPPSGPARAVEVQFPYLAHLWSVCYAVGGAAMAGGLIRRSPRIEGAGLCLLGSGATVALIATLAVRAPVLPTLIGLGGILFACGLRLMVLRRR